MTRQLPDGLEHVRTTNEFNHQTVPPGLLSAHRIAEGVWGRLVVRTGTVTLQFEEPPSERHVVNEGASVVIAPGRPHRVELGDEPVGFAIEFHRPPRTD